MQHLSTSELVATAIFGALMLILTGAVISAFVILLVNLAGRIGYAIKQLLLGCPRK